MSDEKKNAHVANEERRERAQTNGIELTPQKKTKTEQDGNGDANDSMKSEFSDVMANEADSGISEGESAKGELQITDSEEKFKLSLNELCVKTNALGEVADGLRMTCEKSLNELSALSAKAADKSLTKKPHEDGTGASDSEADDMYSLLDKRRDQWSLDENNKFQKCLTKLKVTKDDLQEKTYEELCNMMAQPTVLYRERKNFYFACRGRNESDDEYMKRLTDLSATCQFGDRQDAMIADKFIVSIAEMSSYSRKKSPWTELQQEVDSKRALEISKNDTSDPDDFLSLLEGRRGKGKIPPHLADMIRNEIMEKDLAVEWDDIAGLEFPKSVIRETIVWPMLRPDIFTGLRKIPRAMLLFGPPGTGKTMIAKCIAAQSHSTFFYVSASTMASKCHGESEQLVRALFSVAAEHQPAVIFFDEVDSLLTRRKSEDHEVSRRVKTEFMIQLDGAATKDDARVLFIGATNRPQDLDEAARRRFVKRLYVPLPDLPSRQQLLNILLKNHHSNMTDSDVNEIAAMTNDFSGADIKWLCQDAAMQPIRSIPGDGIKDIDVRDIRPLEKNDFVTSLKRIRPSVASADLTAMVEWNRLYGSNSDRPCTNDNHFMYS